MSATRNSMQLNLPVMPLDKVENHVSTPLKSLEGWRALVTLSIARIGWSQKRTALELGIPESQFSRQLSGVEHLSFWRMGSLPPEFWQELIVLVCDFHEIAVTGCQAERQNAELGRLFREAVERVIR